MKRNLIIQAGAQEDIGQIISWYNQQKLGLGNHFLDMLDQTLGVISQSPGIFQVRYKDVRMASVTKFPISVHYQFFREENKVVVFAVLHQSRNPQIWGEQE